MPELLRDQLSIFNTQ